MFDTNIFVSALMFPGSQAEKAIYRITASVDVLIISREILGEVLKVLADKFNRDAEYISRTALYLADLAEIVKPHGKSNVLKDEPDNRILECALEAKADFIVTGDKEMLMLKEYRGVKIISLGAYLRL